MPIYIIPFFSKVSPDGLSEEVLKELKQDGVEIISPSNASPRKDSSFIFIGTGGTENDVALFLRENNMPLPIILLSYDERNSLPAAMEIRAYLQKKEMAAKIIHRELTNLHVLLKRWSEYERIRERLGKSTIGIIGKPSSWLIASDINLNETKTRWGVEIKEIPMEELIENIPHEISEEFLEQTNDFQKNAERQTIVNDEVMRAGIVAQRMADISKKYELAAITVQCFSLLQDTDISGCFSLSCLNDRKDFVAGCEGDLPATFTMLLAKMLTGSSSFMANVASIDEEFNTVVFAHCTVPRQMTEGYEITTHFETGKSVGIRGKLPLTDVTIIKLFGSDLRQYWISGGTIIDNLVNDKGCRTQIRVAMEESVEYFLEESLANHHIVILGDYVEKFMEFFEFMNFFQD